MKIFRVRWTIPTPDGTALQKIEVFWNTEAEADLHVDTLIKAATVLGYPAPCSWVDKSSVNPGERFFS